MMFGAYLPSTPLATSHLPAPLRSAPWGQASASGTRSAVDRSSTSANIHPSCGRISSRLPTDTVRAWSPLSSALRTYGSRPLGITITGQKDAYAIEPFATVYVDRPPFRTGHYPVRVRGDGTFEFKASDVEHGDAVVLRVQDHSTHTGQQALNARGRESGPREPSVESC